MHIQYTYIILDYAIITVRQILHDMYTSGAVLMQVSGSLSQDVLLSSGHQHLAPLLADIREVGVSNLIIIHISCTSYKSCCLLQASTSICVHTYHTHTWFFELI